jgi:hypothetical protein
MGGRRLPGLELDDAERAELKALTSRRKTGQAVALRARIVLACAQGGENRGVAARLEIDKDTVGTDATACWSRSAACRDGPVGRLPLPRLLPASRARR